MYARGCPIPTERKVPPVHKHAPPPRVGHERQVHALAACGGPVEAGAQVVLHVAAAVVVAVLLKLRARAGRGKGGGWGAVSETASQRGQATHASHPLPLLQPPLPELPVGRLEGDGAVDWKHS